MKYDEYRVHDGQRLPGSVTLLDPAAGVRMVMVPLEVEVGPDLEPWVFTLD